MVFTDIAGSTALLHELGDDYREVLNEHRRRIRAIVDRHGGVEVDTQGDAFFLAFPRASAAVAAAREAVADMASSGPIRIRVGVHTGEPVRTDEGYVGLDVHVAARIAASGSGGQVLVSRQTRELLAAEPIHDLGVHRLKDVGEVHLFQIGTERFPPVRSIGRSNLLPPHETPVGREREVTELRRMLVDERVRLLTLTGAGGIGKTTLARVIASIVGERFPDGLWFVDVSAITEPDRVEPAVATVVGSHGGVIDQLRSADALLVLDNFEQVLDGATHVAEWLDACPGLVVIATSRERLRLSAEQEYPIAPLADQHAAKLFLTRAQAVAPGFHADDAAVLQLCHRLDGIPLAIELAAARVKLLTPGQLLARLDKRLSVLTGGARDRPERQRTLEATIAWSYDLLEPDEQQLLERLSVFAGGWTLEAAEEVTSGNLDQLESLVTKSLVRFADGRFSLFETIRAFTAARLAERGSEEELRRRHAAFFARLAAAAAPELTGGRQDDWLELLAAEDDNLRTALDWCADDPACHQLGQQMAADLAIFWYLRSRPWEAWRWLQPLIAMSDPSDSAARAGALWGAGFFLTIIADERAENYLHDGLAMARRIEDGSLIARSLDVLGLLAFFGNELARAESHLEESISHARTAGDDWCLADALGTVGSIYPLVGKFDQARAAAAEGLTLARSRGDLQGARMSLFGLALTERRSDRNEAALAAAEEGLEISRRLGDGFFTAYFLWLLAGVERERGNVVRAAELADEALLLAREIGVPLLLVCALEVRAAVHRDRGDREHARELLEEAETLGTATSVPGTYLSEALRQLGGLDADTHDLASAERHLQAAVDLARTVNDPWAERRAQTDLNQIIARLSGPLTGS